MNTDEPMVAATPEESGATAEPTTQAAVPAEPATAPQQTDSQGQSEESFTTFDPNSLDPSLTPAYKQMQGDYTRKTQALSQKEKELQAQAQKYAEYAKYEQYVPILEEMSKAQQTAPVTPEMAALEQELRGRGFSDEAIEMMKVGAEFTLRQFNQTLTAKDQQQQQEQQAKTWQSSVEQAQALDPRLIDSTLTYQTEDGTSRSFGQIVEGIVMATPNYQKNLIGATKEAIAVVDAMLGQAKTQGKEELSASAQAKAKRFPANQPSNAKAVDESQPTSMQDAGKQAKQELGL